MALPSISTVPSTRALGTVSCIRLKQRRRVDFPQPEGPMMAVTACCGIDSETFLTAATSPKNALSASVTMHGAASFAGAVGSSARSCTVGVTTRAGLARNASVDWSAKTRPGYEPSDETDDEHDEDQHQRAGPGLAMPLVIGTDGVAEDLQGQSGDRLANRCRPELVAKRGEEQGCRFAGNPGDCNERSGRDPGESRS